MTDQPTPRSPHALSFGAVADSYDRGRPGYPAAAATWLTSPEPVSVLELGAGTGKLTAELAALGHDVHATDPDPEMLAVLEDRLPGVRAGLGTAEDIPAADNSFDVVIAAQSFHWFDLDRAIPEIVRVLRPGGRLSLTWNERDTSIPWVKKLGRLISAGEDADRFDDPEGTLKGSMKFIMVENERFKHWQSVNRRTVWDLARSRPHIAVLDEAAQEERKAELLEFYDGYGRGMDGMQLPYVANSFRARVVKVRHAAPRPAATSPSTSSVRYGGDELRQPVPIIDSSRTAEDTSVSDPLPDLAPTGRTGQPDRAGNPPREPRGIDDTAERIGPIDPPRDPRTEDDDDAMLLIDFR